MRFTRVAAAATSLLLIGAVSTMGSAGAAATGVGTSKTSATVLDVALGNSGSVLDVQVLNDSAQSTIDSAASATPLAFSKLTAAAVTSQAVSALNKSIEVGEARQPGGAPDVNTSVDLASPAGTTVPVNFSKVVSGNLSPAHLTAPAPTVDTAKSTLTSALADLNVAGALLNAKSVANNATTEAVASGASGNRSATIDSVTVLNLGALLDGLGIPLTSLTLSQLDALLAAAKVAVPGLDVGATLASTFASVNTQIAAVEAAVATVDLGTVVNTAGLGGIIDQNTINLVNGITGNLTAQINAAVTALEQGMTDLITNGISALAAAPLLKLSGVEVGVSTKAADTVANSAATVTGKVGSITVGTINLPGVDLLGTVDQINTAIGVVNDTVNNVLATISAPVGGVTVSLDDMISVVPLQKTTSVSAADGYNVASATLTALHVAIKPPAQLAQLVQAIAAQAESASDVVTGTLNQADLADAAAAMTTLNGLLGAGVDAVAGGATVDLFKLNSTSQFKVVTVPGTTSSTPKDAMPATGANSLRLGALGLLLVALGLGLARWLDMPVPAFIKGRRF